MLTILFKLLSVFCVLCENAHVSHPSSSGQNAKLIASFHYIHDIGASMIYVLMFLPSLI